MEILSEKCMELSAEEKQVCVLYQLFSGELEGGYTHYGIRARDAATGETLTIPHITVDGENAWRLFDCLLHGKVTMVTFRDVVEDYLAAI